ncbi:MAG: ClpX C4-type zinc finger protein [Actinomycetota bacterium]
MRASGGQRAPGGTPRGPSGGRARCSFCGRASNETSAIFPGPEWVKICNGCAYGAKAARSEGPGKPRKCSFCGRSPKHVAWIYGGSMVAICDGCTERALGEMLGVGDLA